jgi:hypothetical protein
VAAELSQHQFLADFGNSRVISTAVHIHQSDHRRAVGVLKHIEVADDNFGAMGGNKFLTSEPKLVIGQAQSLTRQSGLLLSGIVGVSNLAEHGYNKQQSNSAKEQRIKSYGIIDRLIDKPREAGLISVLIGICLGAMGIALYLNRGWHFGMVLLGFGALSPLFPWWAGD